MLAMTHTPCWMLPWRACAPLVCNVEARKHHRDACDKHDGPQASCSVWGVVFVHSCRSSPACFEKGSRFKPVRLYGSFYFRTITVISSAVHHCTHVDKSSPVSSLLQHMRMQLVDAATHFDPLPPPSGEHVLELALSKANILLWSPCSSIMMHMYRYGCSASEHILCNAMRGCTGA
jgi:hypothetical protein